MEVKRGRRAASGQKESCLRGAEVLEAAVGWQHRKQGLRRETVKYTVEAK